MIDVLFTATKVAELLGISENALAKMRLTGGGPPFVKIGRRVRYGQSELEIWLTARRYS
ncbi:MAG: helix-turn-helix domain-containing protein [Hyphomicrobiales bacterium]